MADSTSTNHDLTLPEVGSETGSDTENWGSELNSNMSIIDGTLPIVDTEANQSNYSATPGQLYFATDTEVWYRGDGTNWVQQETTGSNPTLDTPTIGSLGGALALNANDITDGGTPVYDASAGVVPANRLASHHNTIYDSNSNGIIDADIDATNGMFSQADVTESLTIGNYASINSSQIVTQATQTITPTTTQTGSYTASNRDCVLCDASGGAFTVTLPSAATDVYVTTKKIDSSTNAVTVATPNTETIDGTSSLSLSSQYDSSTIVSDGTNYFIV